jgi:hypothetical protein
MKITHTKFDFLLLSFFRNCIAKMTGKKAKHINGKRKKGASKKVSIISTL